MPKKSVEQKPKAAPSSGPVKTVPVEEKSKSSPVAPVETMPVEEKPKTSSPKGEGKSKKQTPKQPKQPEQAETAIAPGVADEACFGFANVLSTKESKAMRKA